MRSPEVDRKRAAIIAPASGPFGRDADLRPHPLTRLP